MRLDVLDALTVPGYQSSGPPDHQDRRKPGIVLALLTEAQREAFEEQAAIMEYDGGLTREQAE